jgi:hypothetical protein
MLSSVGRPALEYFSTLSHKRHELKENITKCKASVFIALQYLCGTFLVLRRIQRDIIITVHISGCMYSTGHKLNTTCIECNWTGTLCLSGGNLSTVWRRCNILPEEHAVSETVSSFSVKNWPTTWINSCCPVLITTVLITFVPSKSLESKELNRLFLNFLFSVP